MAVVEIRSPPYSRTTAIDAAKPAGSMVKCAPQAIRSYVAKEVTSVSEFTDCRSIFREVKAPAWEVLNRDLEAAVGAEVKLDRIRNVIEERRLSIVYQGICNVETRRPVGFECLARFSAAPSRSPDVWFTEAAEVGLGPPLELTAIRMALSALSSLPAEIFLAVNASPDAILSSEVRGALDGMPADRIVLELTEHTHVENYDRLVSVLEPLRRRGVRLAVDDAGAGYSSLQHILNLRPDLIKLDMGLTRNIDLDPARRALVSALLGFARETGSRIVAEGIELASELTTLRALGVEWAQGYFLGPPMPLDSAA